MQTFQNILRHFIWQWYIGQLLRSSYRAAIPIKYSKILYCLRICRMFWNWCKKKLFLITYNSAIRLWDRNNHICTIDPNNGDDRWDWLETVGHVYIVLVNILWHIYRLGYLRCITSQDWLNLVPLIFDGTSNFLHLCI